MKLTFMNEPVDNKSLCEVHNISMAELQTMVLKNSGKGSFKIDDLLYTITDMPHSREPKKNRYYKVYTDPSYKGNDLTIGQVAEMFNRKKDTIHKKMKGKDKVKYQNLWIEKSGYIAKGGE